jgi:transposase
MSGTARDQQPPCNVTTEARASTHYRGRAIRDLVHAVRLIPTSCVTPLVKRQKNDMAEAEAIAAPASRSSMRFVAVKNAARQAATMADPIRDLSVRQRTRKINAQRAHPAEQDIVAPIGPAHVGRHAAIIDGDDPFCLKRPVSEGRTALPTPFETRKKGQNQGPWTDLVSECGGGE